MRLTAWWIPARRAAAPVLYYLHGNAANLASFVDIAAACRRRGLAFFAVDYRGYGGSAGRPTEAGLERDALAGWRWLEARGAAGRTVVYGQSLGTALAAWLAARERPAGLVLEAALPSTWHMARLHYPWLFVPEALVWDRFATVRHVARATCPVLVIHGEHDEVSPLRYGRMVFDAAPEPKVWLPVAGAGHNDLDWEAPALQREIAQFIARCLKEARRI